MFKKISQEVDKEETVHDLWGRAPSGVWMNDPIHLIHPNWFSENCRVNCLKLKIFDIVKSLTLFNVLSNTVIRLESPLCIWNCQWSSILLRNA